MPELPIVSPNEPVTASHTNGIMRRTLQRYDDKITRDTENSIPEEGELAFMEDSGSILFYYGAAWRRLIPLGTVLPYAGTSTPPGFLFCHGQAVSRTTYADLFAKIGTTYGAGDGSTTFNLPDLRQRFVLGKAASGTGSSLGGTGGSINHTHSGPSHSHSNPSTGSAGSHSHSVGNTGSSTVPHTHQLTYDSAGVTDYLHINPSDANHSGHGSTQRHWGNSTPDTDSGAGSSHNHSNPNTGSGGSHNHSVGNTGSAGTGQTGSANPPFLVLNHIIKAI